MQDDRRKCVMIISGEASGDSHGARLVRAMRSKSPDLYFCGIGGPAMAAEGVRILVDAKELSVVGFTEVAEKAGTLLKSMMFAKEVLRQVKPDLLVLIDFPDFNLSVAGVARKLGLKVLYYISPQIWAWRQGRVKKIKRLVDHIAVILPFEKEFYDAHGVPATFVGHPLLDGEGDGDLKDSDRTPNMIGLLPGSRNREVRMHLPILIESAALMKGKRPDLNFTVPVAPTVDMPLVRQIMEEAGVDVSAIKVQEGGSGRVLEQSALVIAASGTVTLEAALAGAPTIIIYKMSPTSYFIAKRVAKVDYVGLANLISGQEIMPELLQNDADPEKISQKALEMLNDPQKRAWIGNRLAEVREKLGGPGASSKTAEIALNMLEQ